ncbi:EAL domain-containing protein [Candidatus Reidiella endopervernicosa]|nr:EAL domain-containing protein [Candidatus Reidiella endopervernicosa]
MYKAKEQGRDTFQFYLPSMQLAASERLQMENDLRKAIHNGELSLHYQPQFSIDDRLMGAECLLRWLHPEEGMISQARFIPVAEDSGLILSIGEWVMRSACKQLRMWELEGRGGEINRLAINVSPKQFKQRDFVVMVSRIIEESGIDPSRVELELTEGMLLENVEETIDKMTQLKSIGISFAIDDFGTGYSSLSYLKRLPLDKLKIDQSFVRDIEKGDSGSAIVETIISMTHHLGLEVIAEGVETRGQLDFLKHSGCHHFQGYYFNRPLPVDEFEKELNESINPV